MKDVGRGAPRPWRVLVTGFGAFPGARANPTVRILVELARETTRFRRLGIELRTALIPVVYAEIEPVLGRLARQEPDAILHLGLAGRRTAISVETRARNRAGPLHPDAAGARPTQRLVVGASDFHAATYPAARIAAALRRAALPARRSNEAGDYVCNASLYRALQMRAAPQVGFLHVPRVQKPTQPRARTKRRKPTIAGLTRAVRLAILVMAPRGHDLARAAAANAPTAPSTNVAPADRQRLGPAPAADRPAA